MKARDLISILNSYDGDMDVSVSFSDDISLSEKTIPLHITSCGSQQKRCYQNLVELSPEGLLVLNASDQISYMNPTLLAKLGGTAASLFFKTVYGLVRNEDASLFKRLLINLKNKKNGHDKLGVFGIGKDYTEGEWKTIFRQLIVLGYVDIHPVYSSLMLNENCRPILKGDEKIELGKQIVQKGKVSRFSRGGNNFSIDDDMLFQDLKALRMKIAKSKNLPPYMIFNDESLKDMVALKPVRKMLMKSVSGVGEVKFRNYGEQFMELIVAHVNNEV